MTHFTDKPCAAHGLTSYRYKGFYGYVMIGAKNDQDALNEANRSLTGNAAILEFLEKWDGKEYKGVL